MLEAATRPQHRSLFPSFFQAGFECSTHVNQRGERQDLIKLTQHDRFLDQDYAGVRSLGIACIREGVPWFRVDRRGRYDFRFAGQLIACGLRHGLTQIWDLFHYGFPTYLNPFGDEFVPRFADYCAAFARYLIRRTGDAGVRFYTPVNEPSFHSWAAAEVGWFAPFERGRGFEYKLVLARAAIAGMNAIRAVDPRARFVNVDPVINAVAPLDEPDLAEDAERFNQFQWQTWDMLAGKEWAHLGGSPAHLDIIGVNHYLSGQWEHCRGTTLAFEDPRRKALGELLRQVAQRYPGHPILVTETGCWGNLRPLWLREVVGEALGVLASGIDLQGLCLYPIIDMPDWHGGHFMQFGMWDLLPDGPDLQREVYRPYRDELTRAQLRAQESGLLPVYDPDVPLAGPPGMEDWQLSDEEPAPAVAEPVPADSLPVRVGPILPEALSDARLTEPRDGPAAGPGVAALAPQAALPPGNGTASNGMVKRAVAATRDPKFHLTPLSHTVTIGSLPICGTALTSAVSRKPTSLNFLQSTGATGPIPGQTDRRKW